MITTNHTTLRMSGALNIEHLTSLKLHVGVNAHGWATVEGEAGENALEQLSGALAGREQHIITLDESGAEKCLFAGVIREAEMVRVGGYNRFHVELLSGTCLMDREVRSRSFQDVNRTYSQVAQQVCAEYSGGAAICTVGEDKTLGRPVIQYRETDWEFLMRMASHCGSVLVPETHRGLPRLWFGFPDRSFTCEFPEDAYTSGISQRYYELGGSAAGYSKADFFYYDVESPQLCDLGWYTVFKGQPFIIAEKSARLERGELIFTYRLGRSGFGLGKMLYNEKISGMTLLGEVLETSRETLKLKLDIDAGWNPGGPYPYTWRPETGNFMYCMPQVGTQVSLYCPDYDEKAAIAVNCVRTNGGNCDRMSDPSKRSFVTEHGKEMNLYPEEMSLIGSAMGNVLGNILITDNEGIIFSSKRAISIIANYSIKCSSLRANIYIPNGELVATRRGIKARRLSSDFTMSNRYDICSLAVSDLVGKNCVAYLPFSDAPQETSFDFGMLIDAAVGLLAAVVFVGALGLTGIAAFVVGAVIACTVMGALTGSRSAKAAGLVDYYYWKGVLLSALTGGLYKPGSDIEGIDDLTSEHCAVQSYAAMMGEIDYKPWTTIMGLEWLWLGRDSDKGIAYIDKYKLSWINSFKDVINDASKRYNVPAFAIASVAFVEVGGDPMWSDPIIYSVRSVLHVDDNDTKLLNKNPLLTSYGYLSMQVRRAGETLNYDTPLTDGQINELIKTLKDPVQSVYMVASHLAELRAVDFSDIPVEDMTEEQWAITITRYNVGPNYPYEYLVNSHGYADRILPYKDQVLGMLES